MLTDSKLPLMQPEADRLDGDRLKGTEGREWMYRVDCEGCRGGMSCEQIDRETGGGWGWM